MLHSGARWRDCPLEYGPYTTVYNRFIRWSRQGADSDGSRPAFRDDLARHSDLMSLAVPR
jgi:hypothetical protein